MTMNQDDIVRYKTLYLQTARAYVKELEHGLSRLHKDQQDQEAVKAIHLAAHSLKSQSLMMGYEAAGMFLTVVENLFAALEEKKNQVEKNVLEQLVRGVKKLQSSLDEIEQQDKEMDLTEVTKELQEMTGVKIAVA